MPIAPITGKLRKRLILDISGSLGMGVAAGYYYWYGYHVKMTTNRDAVNAKLKEERLKALQEQ